MNIEHRTANIDSGIPEWRAAAKAGVSLADAAKNKVVAEPAGLVTSSPTKVTGGLVTSSPTNPMLAVIRPSVRDRWLASQLSFFTPQIVENTLRGAMAGNLLAQWLMFDLMEQTWPRLTKNLNEIKTAVIDLEWNMQPLALRGQKPSEEAQRRADVIEGLLLGMRPDEDANENDFEDTLYDVMDGLGKGIAALEVLYSGPGEEGNVSGLWEPRATRWVHPRYYGYPPQPGVEDRLMLNMMEVRFTNPGVVQEDRGRGRGGGREGTGELDWVNGQYARFPREQFILSIFKQKSGHPISGAMLRVLGFWWCASNFSWEWFLNLAQIFGLPIRWATYGKDANLQTITAIEEMLANMGSAGWAAFPEGTKLELFKALESARENPSKAFIDAADTIADLIVLGQTLTSTQGDRGSQALGTIHKDVRDEKIQAVAKRTAKIVNGQLVRSLCRLNFGDEAECPWFQPSAKGGKNLTETATRYKTLLSIPGVELSKQQFYEDNELQVPDGDDEVIVGQAGGAAAEGQSGSGGEEDGEGETPTRAVGRGGERGRGRGRGGEGLGGCGVMHAHGTATEKLINNVLEDLSGVEAKWLGGVKPALRALVAKAGDARLSDKDFVRAVERFQRELPELFNKLDRGALAEALGKAMGTAMVNGVLRGRMKRNIEHRT